VARLWLSDGNHVSALTRSPDNATALAGLGIDPFIGDVMMPSTLASLPRCDVVLYAVGYDRRAEDSKRDVYVNGLENAVRELAPRASRWIYVSSTSVYGQDAGEWVDETS